VNHPAVRLRDVHELGVEQGRLHAHKAAALKDLKPTLRLVEIANGSCLRYERLVGGL
jgi:hypothetical protein